DIARLDQRTDSVRDLVLPAGGLRGLLDERKDVFVEDVDACVDEVRFRPTRFLFHTGNVAVVHLDDAECLRVGDLREGDHGREDHGLHSVAPFALDRTAEYISFALAASRDSAVRRIFDSVPEKRTRDQPSSNWSRHPSTVVTSPPSPRNATSRRGSIVFRL